MKIAIITDLHWGCRNDAKIFQEHQKKFYDEVFFPYIKKHEIKTVFDLGDTFERRKFSNHTSLKVAQESLFEPLSKNNIDFHLLIGNHDIYFRNTLKINTPDLFLKGKYPNITIYDHPQEILMGGRQILMLPWICDDNSTDTMDLINNSKAAVVFGHLEISGFQMYRGQYVDNTKISKDQLLFEKFQTVLSGHYHTRSSNYNIHYLGSPYEMTWADYGDQKGFHVFDTDTLELEFIPNENYMFYKLDYNDTGFETLEELEASFKLDHFKDKFVKLIIKEKNNAYWFDKILDLLSEVNVHHLQVIEDHLFLDIDLEDEEYLKNSAEDTLTILHNFVEQLDIKEVQKKKVDKVLSELYNETLTII